MLKYIDELRQKSRYDNFFAPNVNLDNIMKLTSKALIAQDLRHNWHPCSQMKDFATHHPFIVAKASGPYIEDATGKRVIDAISSWWCKSLGHGHPALKAALKQQLDAFEHVMFGNTTHENIVLLAAKLATLTRGLDKVFYACDGASAVEIALKMSLHAQQIQGHTQRTLLMGLENAYHGETALTMSVSDLGAYRTPYASMLIDYPTLTGIPYVCNEHDPVWQDCAAYWPNLLQQLEHYQDQLSAIIVEPIIQGAAGMRIYSADFLRRLRAWTTQHGIHLIADEIMSGLGRSGLPLACDHAKIEPDFLCLGKGLTGGFLPLSVTLTSSAIYALFYDDYESGKAFLHSHTHSGNALAAAVALATLETFAHEKIYARLPTLATQLTQLMTDIKMETNTIGALRHIGGIVAAELINPKRIPRLGHKLMQIAMQHGALLRPIDNTLYWLPPLNIDSETLLDLKRITQQSLLDVYRSFEVQCKT